MRKISTIELPSIFVSEDPANPNRLQIELVPKSASEVSFYGAQLFRVKDSEGTNECELEYVQVGGGLIRTKQKGVLMGGISNQAASIDTMVFE